MKCWYMTYTPSPSIVRISADSSGDVGCDETVRDPGTGDETIDQTTVLQVGDVGDDERLDCEGSVVLYHGSEEMAERTDRN